MIEDGSSVVAGVDEAGRGPLAGPVIAAAVILPKAFHLPGLNDSKKLSEKQREYLFQHIHDIAIAVSVGRAEVDEIDRLNILYATMLAMKRAIEGLTHVPQWVLIDGNRAPDVKYQTRTIVRGDQTEPAISAASIIAKVTRDREMQTLHACHPHYNFAKHKGYPTAEHIAALIQHGPSSVHRKSFKPVAENMTVIPAKAGIYSDHGS
ncbi:MAG: ribonuclease HII [Gammaproteobacteria bacterium]|nr:ribonuclease HII [Gammaproteobacteria bacterium]